MKTKVVSFLFISFFTKLTVYHGADGGHINTDSTEESLPCVNCEIQSSSDNYPKHPLHEEKMYSLGVFFKTNWFRALQYCRYRGMQLATIYSKDEEIKLEYAMESIGFPLGPVWTSGTDSASEGEYFWTSNGNPVIYTKWLTGVPNGGTRANCLAVTSEGAGYGWNDLNCSEEHYFVCEFFTQNYTQPEIRDLRYV